MACNNLPILLVSSDDDQCAKNLISGLVGNEIRSRDNAEENEAVVWRLRNKYYTADVRVEVFTGEPPLKDILNKVEAHIIYIPNETADIESRADKHLAIIKDAPALEIRLLLYEGEHASCALSNWGHKNHYEIVPLKENSNLNEEVSDTDEPFKETFGIERARSTLHAHTWSGLLRNDKLSQLTTFDQLALSSDEEWVGEDEGDDENEEDVVERAEAFAMAMDALRSARDSRTDAGHGVAQSDELRRLRAEEVLGAFCRALGTDLNIL